MFAHISEYNKSKISMRLGCDCNRFIEFLMKNIFQIYFVIVAYKGSPPRKAMKLIFKRNPDDVIRTLHKSFHNEIWVQINMTNNNI